MKLEEVTAEIRPRAPWESIDLGCSLARKHIGDIWKAWALTVFPLWLLLALLLRNHPFLLILCIWWLKPIYDRVPLMVVSRALFGAAPNVKEVLAAWPKLIVRRIWFALVVGRFSPARSLSLPVAELEGLRGATYRQRVNLLERNGGEGATMATLAGMVLEGVTGLGLIMLVMMMVPEHVSSNWWDGVSEFFVHSSYSDFSVGFFWLAAGVQMFAITVMEPFYVSAGFALYINSRTLTEGWDIELAFKRLGIRLRNLAGKSGVALLAILLTGFLAVPTARAAEEGYRESAEEVLSHEDFTIHHRNVKVPVDRSSSSSPSWLSELLSGSGMPTFMGLVGKLLFYIILAAVIGGLVYLIIRNRHIFSGGGSLAKSGEQRIKTEEIMGMDVRPESLPADIADAARKAWRDGNSHLALSLLYRGAIAWLVNREMLPIEESDTEGDCLRRVQTVGNTAYGPYFSELTGAWVNVAYGKKDPDGNHMIELCDSWPFDSAVASKNGRGAR
ncbi:hypothetical protein NT6N_06900 [Oceaniferula spumae]|uniref:DUF4129 domain-containing protein n=1 Tax=Oceaniferula spumae TaxID=2979115 RepID=A0AAT9FI36_9BACT